MGSDRTPPGGGFAASMKNEEGGRRDGAADLSKQPGGACDPE